MKDQCLEVSSGQNPQVRDKVIHLKLSVLLDLQLRHGNYTDTDMEIYEEIQTSYKELR